MKKDEEKALELHTKSIVIDGTEHTSVQSHPEQYFHRLIKAGVTAANMTVTPSSASPLEHIKGLKVWYDLFKDHSDKVMLVTTGQDIEKAKIEGKFGVIMGSQNADMLGGDLDLLSVYKRLGVRIIQLSYYRQNLLGEGCGERTNSGLSRFGIEVVQEMNRLRLVIDVSHCGDQVTMDAIKYSSYPVLFTHANARSMVYAARNKTDEQIKFLAGKGGVIGVNSYSPFCQVRKGVRPTLEDYLDIIDYIVELVGPDYVGIGTDVSGYETKESYEKWAQFYPDLRYDYFERTIFTNEEGREEIERIPEITRGLVARGYSEQDIEKILGLNFLRVFKEVWEA